MRNGWRQGLAPRELRWEHRPGAFVPSKGPPRINMSTISPIFSPSCFSLYAVYFALLIFPIPFLLSLSRSFGSFFERFHSFASSERNLKLASHSLY